jgi:hypothetical protein
MRHPALLLLPLALWLGATALLLAQAPGCGTAPPPAAGPAPAVVWLELGPPGYYTVACVGTAPPYATVFRAVWLTVDAYDAVALGLDPAAVACTAELVALAAERAPTDEAL